MSASSPFNIAFSDILFSGVITLYTFFGTYIKKNCFNPGAVSFCRLIELGPGVFGKILGVNYGNFSPAQSFFNKRFGNFKSLSGNQLISRIIADFLADTVGAYNCFSRKMIYRKSAFSASRKADNKNQRFF